MSWPSTRNQQSSTSQEFPNGSPRDYVELIPASNLSKWTDRVAPAGCTWTQDTTVLFDGRPTIRLDIPAGATGNMVLGTQAEAEGTLPFNWNGTGMQIAMRTTNLNTVSEVTPYLAMDNDFDGFYTWDGEKNISATPETIPQPNEWIVFKPVTPTAGGSADDFTTLSGRHRMRLRCNLKVSSQAQSVWFGFFGICPKRVPTVILSIDDGYLTWKTFLAQMLKYYKIPTSMGVDSGLVGKPDFCTQEDLLAFHNDPSDLFELVNHGYNNQSYNGVGAAQYRDNMIRTRDYLHGIGVGDGALHHPWVQSQYGDDVIQMVQAEGFLSARAGVNENQLGIDDRLFVSEQDKWRWVLPCCVTLTQDTSIMAAKTAVMGAVSDNKYGVTHINAHSFGVMDAVSPPTWGYSKTVEFLSWLAELRDTGAIRFQTWGKWYSDVTGRPYKK